LQYGQHAGALQWLQSFLDWSDCEQNSVVGLSCLQSSGLIPCAVALNRSTVHDSDDRQNKASVCLRVQYTLSFAQCIRYTIRSVLSVLNLETNYSLAAFRDRQHEEATQ
jgi:hypothetical protein